MATEAPKPLAPIQELKRVLGALFAVPKAEIEQAEVERVKKSSRKPKV
jgi:hypothetical protein